MGDVIALAPSTPASVGPVGHLSDSADAARRGWTAFYRDEYPRLANAMLTYTGDREVASELAQEAMARAWSHWPRVAQLENPAAWTCRVALNLANSTWRRLLLAGRFAGHTTDEGTTVEPDVGMRLVVRQAVAQLPRRQRTAVVLRYLFDLSIEDVARLMRCRAGTVSALTTQAIEKLRSGGALNEHEGNR